MAVGKVDYSSVPVNEKNGDLPTKPKPTKGFGTRHTQILLLFISLSVGWCTKAHLSVSLVAMTSNATSHLWNTTDCFNKTDSNNASEIFKENTTDAEDCMEFEDAKSDWSVYKTYPWHKPTQEMILFSFFVGYTGMMLPTGILAQKYGGKVPIMVALAANGVLSILTPWMPLIGGWIGVSICRLLQGATQAAFYPSIHTLLGRWAPLSERSRLSSYIYSGSQFGTVLAFQVAGFFAGSPSLGWPASFWLFGVASLACFGLLWRYGAASPHEHPTISIEELEYIVGGSGADAVPKKRRTPWKSILTSPAIWGIIATHVGSAMGYLFVLTQIPLYMNKILGVDIKKNGVYSSLPYIFMYLTVIVFGNFADWVMNKKYLSIVNIRRVGNTIGMMVSSMFLVGFSYVNSTLMSVILLILCLSAHSGIFVGFTVNSIDLAPNFAGPIMALGNMIANLSSLINPLLVSYIVGDDVENQHKWQILFLIIFSIQTVTNLIYVVFAKGSIQEWNYHDEHRNEEDADKKELQEKNRTLKK